MNCPGNSFFFELRKRLGVVSFFGFDFTLCHFKAVRSSSLSLMLTAKRVNSYSATTNLLLYFIVVTQEITDFKQNKRT